MRLKKKSIQLNYRLDITREDFGYGTYHYNESAYKRIDKLTQAQRKKFYELDLLINYEVNFIIRGKLIPVEIMAVSLPDSTVTVYPTGEICKTHNTPFADVYSSHPYQFFIKYKNSGYWTSNIDGVDFSKSVRRLNKKKFLKMKSLEEVNKKYC